MALTLVRLVRPQQAAACRAFSTAFYSDPNFPRHNGRVHHLDVTEGEIANRVVSVGDTARAEKMAKNFDKDSKVFVKLAPRGFKIFTGRYNKVPVTIVATGMGFPNMDFVVRETRAVVTGPMAFARFGTSGGLGKSPPGVVAVATKGCVNILRNPVHWMNGSGEPYMISPVLPGDSKFAALLKEEMINVLGKERVVEGINVSADTFYASQARTGTAFDDRNKDLLHQVTAMHPEVACCEMESFHMFDLAKNSFGSIVAACSAMTLSSRVSNAVVTLEDQQMLELGGCLATLKAISRVPLDESKTMKGSNCVWEQ